MLLTASEGKLGAIASQDSNVQRAVALLPGTLKTAHSALDKTAGLAKILGPTPEILNNHGYSYLLRGDYAHARAKLRAAYQRDPRNPYIQANLDLLEKSERRR